MRIPKALVEQGIPNFVDAAGENSDYASFIEVYHNGEKSDLLWKCVNQETGIGERYCLDKDGNPQIVGDEALTRVEKGTFELRWKYNVES